MMLDEISLHGPGATVTKNEQKQDEDQDHVEDEVDGINQHHDEEWVKV